MSLAQYVNGVVTRLEQLGFDRDDHHIKCMSSKRSAPRTLDLFEHTLTIPTPTSEPASAMREPSAVASLSDDELAQKLIQLVHEVQRRLGDRTRSQPQLKAAVKQAYIDLKELAPSSQKQSTLRRSSGDTSRLQEGQRKAVRAALMAGVTPRQVAKHFGLPLAAIGKVMDESTKA
jgi:hypothetical protein